MKKKLQSEIKLLGEKLIAKDTNFNTLEVKATIAKLYEKLSVLAYLEGELSDSNDTIEKEALSSKRFREEHWFKEPEPLPFSENQEELVEPLMEKIKDLVAQMPAETQRLDEILDEVLPKKKYVKNDLEEFASNYQQTPTFERKVTEEPAKTVTLEVQEPAKEDEVPTPKKKQIRDLDPLEMPIENKPKSINDSINNGLNIGLNDRLAFIKHLFNGSSDDYARVLSQINSMESYEQADRFIKGKVKPEYNYWLDKDEYKDRFMSIVEKRFN